MIARQLAETLVALHARPLPAELSARATALLLDFLGVTIGGSREESSTTVRRALGTLGGTGAATVIGTRERLPATEAAIANGAAAHALEMDDTHLGGSIHLGASVFPAALAAAELAGADGGSVLTAAVGGYEVAARVAMALDPAAHYRRGFHPTGTCGAFGAAAAAGLVLGHDAATIANALGIAGTQASGSMEFLADGAWTKRLHPGWAATAGLHAAALARRRLPRARGGVRGARRRAARVFRRRQHRRHSSPPASGRCCARRSSRTPAAATCRDRSTRRWHSAPNTRSPPTPSSASRSACSPPARQSCASRASRSAVPDRSSTRSSVCPSGSPWPSSAAPPHPTTSRRRCSATRPSTA